MKRIVTILILLLSINSYGQKKLTNTGFFGNQQSDVCANTAAAFDDPQVTDLITNMCGKLGYKNRYIIKSCSQVANCQALIYQGRPYILYNASFLDKVKGLNFSNATLPNGAPDWRALTILAHELGHHVNLHLMNPDPNMTQVEMELEADEFAGHLMHLLGATLSQAQLAMDNPAISLKDSYTHPGKAKRLAAIERGYKQSDIPTAKVDLPLEKTVQPRNDIPINNLTDKLTFEAYERMKENVRVAQILISCTPGTDTIVPLRRIDSIYHLINSNRADFGTMAKYCSDDKGSKENGGDLGYFTALQTFYPFENVAYNTPVGSISQPFKTQFGYHIVKVLDRRPDRGQVKVAQILIQFNKNEGATGEVRARQRADSVMSLLRNGISFGELVKMYSDDKVSANDYGILKPFGAGKMVPEFESAAFALEHSGDISQPIRTNYGYHIIKMIARYPLGPYEELYPELKKKVENDSRSQVTNSLPERHSDPPLRSLAGNTETLFTYGSRQVSKEVFLRVYKNNKKGTNTDMSAAAVRSYLDLYALFKMKIAEAETQMLDTVGSIRSDLDNYRKQLLKNYPASEHKQRLADPAIKKLIDEYREGIVVFELMDRNVWSKAEKDAAGLRTFYDQNKGKFPGQKPLAEVRKEAVALYQNYLEKQWNEMIRRKYPMKVNEEVFTSMLVK